MCFQVVSITKRNRTGQRNINDWLHFPPGIPENRADVFEGSVHVLRRLRWGWWINMHTHTHKDKKGQNPKHEQAWPEERRLTHLCSSDHNIAWRIHKQHHTRRHQSKYKPRPDLGIILKQRRPNQPHGKVEKSGLIIKRKVGSTCVRAVRWKMEHTLQYLRASGLSYTL